jgi:hypothetical protein
MSSSATLKFLLEQENKRLKEMVADLALANEILKWQS